MMHATGSGLSGRGGIVCALLLSIGVAGVLAQAVNTGAAKPQTSPEPNASDDVLEMNERIRAMEAPVQAREKRIDSELSKLGDQAKLEGGDWVKEWAGMYYTGDGLGMNVSIKIAPKAGVTYMWRGCGGLYDANYGDIAEILADGLKVKLAMDESLGYEHFMSSRLYFVRWGDSRYLIPEAEMLNLVNDLNRGSTLGWAMLMMPRKYTNIAEIQKRRAGPEGDPPGHPVLPEQYARMLLKAPLTLTISSVTPDGTRKAPGGMLRLFDASLSAGKNQGMYTGQALEYYIGSNWAGIVVKDVSADSCVAEVRMGPDSDHAPSVGDTITIKGVDPAIWEDLKQDAPSPEPAR